MAARFSGQNFLLRFFAALVLVFATYNPEGYSYYHWAIAKLPETGLPGFDVLKAFVGVVLLIGWPGGALCRAGGFDRSAWAGAAHGHSNPWPMARACHQVTSLQSSLSSNT